MTISGRCRVRRAWRRSRWKYCAGVVGLADPDVALGRELQEPLEPGARVLRALALVAVRQEQREPGRQPPLGEPGAEELVHDDLGAVDEVAELGLPQHQRLGRRRAVAVLEAQRGQLAQRAVVQLERRERAGQPLDRRQPLAGDARRAARGAAG